MTMDTAMHVAGWVCLSLGGATAVRSIVSDIRRHGPAILAALFPTGADDPTVTAAQSAAAERLGVRHG